MTDGNFLFVGQLAIGLFGQAAITQPGDSRAFGTAGAVCLMLHDLQVAGFIVGVETRVIFQLSGIRGGLEIR
ncbi:hypothetical protein D3C80_2085680 [compost metagenome]